MKILDDKGVFLPSELTSLYFNNGGYVLDTLRVVDIVPGSLRDKVEYQFMLGVGSVNSVDFVGYELVLWDLYEFEVLKCKFGQRFQAGDIIMGQADWLEFRWFDERQSLQIGYSGKGNAEIFQIEICWGDHNF